jgi:hypothetical protein
MVTYWFFLDKELSRLLADFKNIFDCEFIGDYEDYWEWLEGYNINLDCKINISRPHNWNTGDYLEPIVVTLYIDDIRVADKDFIQFYGDLLSGVFNTVVSFGDVVYIDSYKANFIIKSTFN